jgi:putative cell wall-binding protein
MLTTGGTAFAAELAGAAASSANPTVYPGSSANAAGDLTLSMANVRSIGDTLTVQLAAAGAPGCATTGGAVGFAGTPTVAVSGPFTAALGSTAGTDTDDVKPTFTVATQSSAGACTVAGVKDQLVITLTNSAANAGDFYTFTVSGQKIDVGSKVGAGAITETSNAHPATIATVSTTKLTVASSLGATDGATVTVPTITATDVTGGQIAADVTFTLPAGDVWASKGTLTAPSGVTVDSGTIATNVLTYAITAGTVGANGTFTLSGATATLNGSGAHTVDVSTNGGTAFGSTLQVAFVAAPTRIGGADRYATAALIYSQKYSAATSAVIASGANFPDALSAPALARAKSTGVLLTDPNNLSGATKQALITGTGPVSTVYIVGGPAAVSDNVFNQSGALKNSSGNAINVIRVFGADRYATNAAVDLQAGVTGTIGGGSAIVATGEGFADALAVGPAIYATGWPLILTPTADLNATAKSTIAALGITNAVIVGGPKAVSATAEASLKTAGVTVTNRLAGDTRTLTAAEIAKWELTGTGATFAESGYNGNAGLGFSGATVNIARGDTYPDALASGAWLGNATVKEVLLLTDSPTALGAGIPALLAGANGTYGTTNVNAIGLAGALSTPTVTAAVGSIS